MTHQHSQERAQAAPALTRANHDAPQSPVEVPVMGGAEAHIEEPLVVDSRRQTRPQTRANPSDDPSRPRRVRCKLDTIDDVKVELARLYRSAKGGEIETQDASRLANMLSIHSRLIEGSDLEKRLSELEAATQKQGDKPWSARRH